MKKIKFIIILVFVSVAAHSNDQKYQFVTENYPPLQIKTKGKPLTGFAVEFVQAMIEKAGINAEVINYPWARAYMIAKQQPNTFIFSIARTKAREDLFQWVGDYYTETDAFFALASRQDIVLNSIEDAKKYTTAVPRGDVAALRLESHNFTQKNLVYLGSQKQSLQMLNMGRVDLNSNNDLGFSTLTNQLGIYPDKFKKVFVISEMNLGIAASIKTPKHIVQKMRQALTEVKNNGTHARLIKKWFPNKT